MEASRFLATTLWIVDGATSDCGVCRKGKGVARVLEPQELPYPTCPCLTKLREKAKTAGLGSKVSLLSKMARSVSPVYAMNWSDTCGT